jgi:3-oxoacyl-[acyl-carrier protein] reductase
MDSDLSGQAVLITGASGGIGQATARAFAAEGARVGVHYHRNNHAAEALAADLGEEAMPLRADLRDEEEVAAMFAHAVEAFGRLDAVVVNAGVWVERPTPLGEMSLEQWEETLATDLTGAFLTCRGFLRHLGAAPREAASIVLVGSTAALFGEEGHGDYSAAKAGLTYGLSRTLKNEIVRLAPRGRVNCVCPGWVMTPMAEGALADAGAVERVTATMALRKVATPEDVARAIVFLTSDRLAGHLSGTILPVAGGMEGRLLHPR